MTSAELDSALCDQLATQTVKGDTAARHLLVTTLRPLWIQIVRKDKSLRSLARSKEHVDGVVGDLVEKFSDPSARAVRTYLDWRSSNRDKNFADWNRIVTKRQIFDYLRKQVGSSKIPVGQLSPKRLLNEVAMSPLVDEFGLRPPFTIEVLAREVLAFAQSRFPREQLDVLRLWLSGETFEEMGTELGMSAMEAAKLLDAAVKRLRRHFRREESET